MGFVELWATFGRAATRKSVASLPCSSPFDLCHGAHVRSSWGASSAPGHFARGGARASRSASLQIGSGPVSS